MDFFIQSELVDETVPFHDRLERLKLKALTSDGVIKKDKIQTIPLLIYYLKIYVLHLLISALILETL